MGVSFLGFDIKSRKIHNFKQPKTNIPEINRNTPKIKNEIRLKCVSQPGTHRNSRLVEAFSDAKIENFGLIELKPPELAVGV